MTASSSKIQGYFYYQQRSFNKSRLDQFAWLKRWNIFFLCLSTFFFLKRGHRFHSERAFSNNNWQKKKKKHQHLWRVILKRETEWVQTKAANMLDTGTFGWAGKSALHSELTVSARSRLIRAISASFCVSLMHVWCNSGQEASNPSPWHIYCNGWYDMNRNKRWGWAGCRALCCFGGWK